MTRGRWPDEVILHGGADKFRRAWPVDDRSVQFSLRTCTGNGLEPHVPRVSVNHIKAMGHERSNFPVLAHTLPPNTSVDGLLGLDYMQAHVMRIDFRRSTISLT